MNDYSKTQQEINNENAKNDIRKTLTPNINKKLRIKNADGVVTNQFFTDVELMAEAAWQASEAGAEAVWYTINPVMLHAKGATGDTDISKTG